MAKKSDTGVPTLPVPDEADSVVISKEVATSANEEKTTILSEDSTSQDVPFSVFTKRQKLAINLITSFAAMFSTLSSYIYYPAIVPISRDLGVSVSLINLTVTSYLIVAAVAPAFMGDMADSSGRRPIYVVMFVLSISANVGMAVQKSFVALLLLRMIQSAGASGMNSAIVVSLTV